MECAHFSSLLMTRSRDVQPYCFDQSIPGMTCPGRPGGVSGYPRAWYRLGQFREFEPPRVHTRLNS